MKKLITLFIAVLGSAFNTSAQEIKGVVVDATSKEVVPSATIIIEYSDKTDRTVSNDKGEFYFKPQKFPVNVKATIWDIVSDSVYLDKYPEGNTITVLMPTNAIELDEVAVTGHARLTSITDKGFSYKMSANERAQEENTLQSLSYVPLVNVDANGSITVQGSSSYSLYLNGRPYEMAQTSPKAFLETLPASEIAKVEVITNPTSKMGPSAQRYIINIVTKKELVDGYVMNLGAGGNTQPKANGSLLGMLKKGDVDASVTYDYELNGQRDQPVVMDYSVPATENITARHWTTHMLGNGNWHTHTVRAMVKWQIDSLNTLYADAHGRINATNTTGTEWNNSDKLLPNMAHIDNISKLTAGTAEANIVYRNYSAEDLDTERFTAGYHFTYNPDRRHLLQRHYLDDMSIFEAYQNTDGGMQEHYGLLSYMWKVNDRNYARFTMKDFYRIGDTRSVNMTDEEEFSSMNYHNNILNGTISYSGTIGQRLMIQAALQFNYDYFKMRLPQNKMNDFDNHNFYFMPSASLYWMPDNKNTLYLTYTTNITRPTVQMLNPFVSNPNSNTISQGNPNLKAQYSHDIALNWFFNGPHNLSLNTSISYSHTNNIIHNYSYWGEENKVIYTYGNMGVGHNIGVTTNLRWNAAEWLMLSANGSIGINKLEAADIGLNQTDWYYSFAPSLDFLLPKHFRLGMNGGLYKNAPAPWTENKHIYMYSFYANKSFLKGRLNVSITANSPFNKYIRSRSTTTLPNITTTQTNYITARSFGINLSYSFGSGQKVNVQRDRTLRATDQSTGVN